MGQVACTEASTLGHGPGCPEGIPGGISQVDNLRRHDIPNDGDVQGVLSELADLLDGLVRHAHDTLPPYERNYPSPNDQDLYW